MEHFKYTDFYNSSTVVKANNLTTQANAVKLIALTITNNNKAL